MAQAKLYRGRCDVSGCCLTPGVGRILGGRSLGPEKPGGEKNISWTSRPLGSATHAGLVSVFPAQEHPWSVHQNEAEPTHCQSWSFRASPGTHRVVRGGKLLKSLPPNTHSINLCPSHPAQTGPQVSSTNLPFGDLPETNLCTGFPSCLTGAQDSEVNSLVFASKRAEQNFSDPSGTTDVDICITCGVTKGSHYWTVIRASSCLPSGVIVKTIISSFKSTQEQS